MLSATQSNSFGDSVSRIKSYRLIEVDFGFSVDRDRLEFFFLDGFDGNSDLVKIHFSFMRFKLESEEKEILIYNGLEVLESLKGGRLEIAAGKSNLEYRSRESHGWEGEEIVEYLQVLDENLFTYFSGECPIWKLGIYQDEYEVGNLYSLDCFLDYSSTRVMSVDRFLDGDIVLDHVRFAIMTYSSYGHYSTRAETYSRVKYWLESGNLIHLTNGESLVLEDGVIKLKTNVKGILREHVDSISYTLDI